jgi:hypothetical protein
MRTRKTFQPQARLRRFLGPAPERHQSELVPRADGWRRRFITAGLCTAALAALLVPREAAAQAIPPAAPRDENWEAVSQIAMITGVASVTLMPRVYYNDPDATVGWKGRWHVSQLAPALTLTAATLFVDIPVKGAIESARPGCTLDETRVAFPDSECESFGGPSTHAFASSATFGAGLAIWIFDTFVYSDSEFHAGSFIGNVAVPLTAAVFTSIARGVAPGESESFEEGGQIGAGIAVGLPIGFLTGMAYTLLQEPNCGYGNNIICW